MAHSAVVGPTTAPDLHVMSFNIRRRLPRLMPRSPDRWATRRPLVQRLLRAELPALLGVQEALADQARALQRALGPHYRSIGHGRERNTGGEGCPIFYDTRRLLLLDWRQTALSDTPEIPGSTSWGNRVPRIVIDARFRDRDTGIEFQAINTHLDHRSRTSRMRATVELRRLVQASPLPTILTGDFNTDAGTGPYLALTADGMLRDTWHTADHRLTESWGTYPNYRDPKHNRKRVDWILVTAGIRVLSAAINVTRYDGYWPSDHTPVQAVVTLGQGYEAK